MPSADARKQNIKDIILSARAKELHDKSLRAIGRLHLLSHRTISIENCELGFSHLFIYIQLLDQKKIGVQ